MSSHVRPAKLSWRLCLCYQGKPKNEKFSIIHQRRQLSKERCFWALTLLIVLSQCMITSFNAMTIKPPQNAWHSPILSWPRIMFSKCVCDDFFHRRYNKCCKMECFRKQTECLYNKSSVLSHMVYIFHLFNILQTYYSFSHPGWQDSTICGALITMNYDHHPAYNDDDDYDRWSRLLYWRQYGGGGGSGAKGLPHLPHALHQLHHHCGCIYKVSFSLIS